MGADPTGGRRTDGRPTEEEPARRLRLVDTEEELPESKPGGWYPEEDGGRESGGHPEDYDTYDGYEHPEDAAGESLASADGPTVAKEMARARLDLVDLLLEDTQAGELFERQCREGLIGIHETAKALRLAMEERGQHHEQGAVEVAIPELAVKTYPASAAAAWERLLARARRTEKVRRGDGAVAAVVDLAAKEEWCFRAMTHLALDSEGPHEAELLAVTREVYAVLHRRGWRYPARRFSEHVWRAVGEVMPSAPGVRFNDTWADDLMRRAIKHIAEAKVSGRSKDFDTEKVALAEDEVGEAYAAEDRRRYRRAVRAWASLQASPKTSSEEGGSTDAALTFEALAALARETLSAGEAVGSEWQR